MERGRVGVVGTGGIVGTHCAAWQGVAGVGIVGIHGRDPVRGRVVASTTRVPYYSELDSLLAHCSIIDVCVPNGLHKAIVLQALDAGCDVVCEKPLALTIEDALAIQQRARARGKMVRMVHQRRYEPVFVDMKHLLAAGALGTVVAGYMHLGCYRPEAYYTESTWHGTNTLDGGVWFNQGAHLLDLWLWLLGGVEAVQAVSINQLQRGDAADTAGALLYSRGGTIGTIVGSTATYPGTPAELGLFGTSGTIRVNDTEILQWSPSMQERPTAMGSTGAYGKAQDLAIEPFRRAFTAYVEEFLQQRGPQVEGVALTHLIDGIHQAAASQTLVHLDPAWWTELE